LVIGDRNDRDICEGLVEGLEILQIQTAMQCRQRAVGEISDQREMQQIDVEMQDIKLMRAAANFLQHHHLMRQLVLDRRVKPQRDVRAGYEPGVGDGVAAGKKRDFVALCNKFFG
jgi:hypothetical protein